MENTYRVVKVTEPNYGSSKLQTNYQIDKFDKGIKFLELELTQISGEEEVTTVLVMCGFL